MRFLFITQYFPPEIGASQVRMAATVRQLRNLGHEVEVVTAMPNHPTPSIFPEYRGKFYLREEWETLPVHRVWLYASQGAGIKRMINYFSFMLLALIGVFKAKRPDYVFVDSPPMFLAITAWIASKWFKAPMIFNVADLWPDSVRELGLMKEGWMLRFAESLEQWSYKHASFVTAVTDGIHKVLLEKKNVPEAKVLYLPNGVDMEVFCPQKPDLELAQHLGLEGKQVLLYAGTHGYAHGIEFALQAAKKLEHTNVMFVFIGDGSQKAELVQMSKDLGLRNVLFLDPGQPEYVAKLFALSFAGLSTLRNSPLFEGTRPAKIFATMSCAKPVIYSGQGEGANLLRQANAGLMSPPEDVDALVKSIEELLADPQKAAQLGLNGRQYVEIHFSWKALVKEWLGQLENRSHRIPTQPTPHKR